jgi:hypothetical protein
MKKTNDINPFEARLEAAFRPVHPSNDFVRTMRQRINFRAPVEVTQRLAEPSTLLLILGGVLSVSLLIITTVRAIFYLTNRSKA